MFTMYGQKSQVGCHEGEIEALSVPYVADIKRGDASVILSWSLFQHLWS